MSSTHQLLYYLTRGLTYTLGQVAHRDGLGGHESLFDLDRLLLDRGLLALGALAAAYVLVIHIGRRGALGQLPAVLSYMLRIMLAHVVLLVGIVIGYALLLDRRREIAGGLAAHRTLACTAGTRRAAGRGTRAAHAGTCGSVALRTVKSALSALTCGAAIRTLAVVALLYGAAIRTLAVVALLYGTAIRALAVVALLYGAAIRALAVVALLYGAAIRTLAVVALLHGAAIWALRARAGLSRTAIALLRISRLILVLRRSAATLALTVIVIRAAVGLSLSGLCRGRCFGCARRLLSGLGGLGGAGLRFGGLSSLVLRRELVGRKCVHEYGRFHARVLALFFLLLSFAGGELILERLQRTQRVLRLLARFRYGFKQPARIGGNFLGCVLYLDFGHLNYAPPRIAIGKYQFSVSTI